MRKCDQHCHCSPSHNRCYHLPPPRVVLRGTRPAGRDRRFYQSTAGQRLAEIEWSCLVNQTERLHQASGKAAEGRAAAVRASPIRAPKAKRRQPAA